MRVCEDVARIRSNSLAGAGRRSERDIPRGLCGPIPASRLRAACCSKEGEVGHCDSEARSRSDPAAAPACAQDGRKVKVANRGYTASSGNVFADLNLPEADDLLAKAELMTKIIAEIQRRRLTQAQAASLLGIDQPKILALKQGKLAGFSIERLMRFLLLLGRDVEISIRNKPKSRSAARLRVA